MKNTNIRHNKISLQDTATDYAVDILINSIKAVWDNTTGNFLEPKDVLTTIFSNASKYLNLVIRESIIKYARSHSDVSLVKGLKKVLTR